MSSEHLKVDKMFVTALSKFATKKEKQKYVKYRCTEDSSGDIVVADIYSKTNDNLQSYNGSNFDLDELIFDNAAENIATELEKTKEMLNVSGLGTNFLYEILSDSLPVRELAEIIAQYCDIKHESAFRKRDEDNFLYARSIK